MATIVSAPGDLVVATSDRIDVRFAGVEVDADTPPSAAHPQAGRGVQIWLEGIRGTETQRRDYAFLDARAAWVDRMKGQGKDGAAGDMPTMPGVLVLEPVKAIVTDDMGTEYRLE